MIGDQTVLESFRQDGFVHLTGFMDEAEIDAIDTQVVEVIEDLVPTLDRTEAMYEDYERPETLKQVNIPARKVLNITNPNLTCISRNKRSNVTSI